MRKTLMRMGLGIALVVGAAGVAAAQSAQPNARPDTTQRDHRRWDGEHGGRRRGGPEGALLRGINLTDAQKDRLEAIRKEQEPEMHKTRDHFAAVMKEAREARQRGDTTAARAKMEQVRTQMDKQREKHIAALRTVLTAEQRKQLDANIATMKERGAEGGHRHGGERPGAGVGR